MSIFVAYSGRFGNNIFQYSFARLIAQISHLRMETSWPHQSILPVTPTIPGDCWSGQPRHEITDKTVTHPSFSLNVKPHGRKRFECSGFFQKADWYYNNKDLVKSFFTMPTLAPESDDIVMHVRLTDYSYSWKQSRIVHHQWYLDILAKEKYRNLIICTDDPSSPYFKSFAHLKPTIRTPKHYIEDFHEMRRYTRVICGNSTFCWWSAFFGNAKKVYIFKPWVMDPTVHGLTQFPGSIPLDGPIEPA